MQICYDLAYLHTTMVKTAYFQGVTSLSRHKSHKRSLQKMLTVQRVLHLSMVRMWSGRKSVSGKGALEPGMASFERQSSFPVWGDQIVLPTGNWKRTIIQVQIKLTTASCKANITLRINYCSFYQCQIEGTSNSFPTDGYGTQLKSCGNISSLLI